MSILMRVLAVFLLWLSISTHVISADKEQAGFQFQNLTENDYFKGVRQYLVYMHNIETGDLLHQAVWTRNTDIITRNGEKLVETTQKWVSSTDNWNRTLHSLNRINDFSPISHYSSHGNDKVISAYLFSDTQVSGDKSVASNSKSDFIMPKQAETLNWELDMETFALLPLEVGKTFAVNFYHPGSSSPPQVYHYTVTREEKLTDILGNSIDCWVMHIKYGEEGFADFWIDKETKQTIKMVEDYGENRRYKILLGVPFEMATH